MRDLVTRYLDKGIYLFTQDGRLQFRARNAALTPDIRGELVARKPEILEALNDPAAPQRLPLTANQTALFLYQMRHPDSPAYNVSVSLPLSGATDAQHVVKALCTLARRHAALALVYAHAGGRPLQWHNPLTSGDLIVETDGDPEAFTRRPFALDGTPMMRALIHGEGEGRHLRLVIHHLNVDFWSLGLIAADLAALLRGAALPDTTPERTFVDHLAEEFLADADKAAAGIAQDLAQRWQPQALPGFDTDTAPGAASRMTLPFTPTLQQGLSRCARQLGVSDFVATLCAVFVMLHRLTGTEVLSVCIPTFGRKAEDRSVVGYFVNPVPLCVDFREITTLPDLARSLHAQVLESLDRKGPAFSDLVSEIRARHGADITTPFPLFVNWNAVPGRKDIREALRGADLDQVGGFVPLMLTFFETDDDLRSVWTFLDRCADDVPRWMALFHDILQGQIDNPVVALDDLPWVSAQDQALIDGWNATMQDFGAPCTLAQSIRRQVLATPDAVALEFRDQRLSYRVLLDRAEVLAGRIRSAVAGQQSGVGQQSGAGHFVGICMDRSLEMLVALVAIELADCAFVPLAPDYPADRLRELVADAGLSLVCVHEATCDKVGLEAAVLLREDGATPYPPTRDADAAKDVHAPAYMLYTSGSTGKPKGAIVDHAALFNRLAWMQDRYPIGPGDRVLQKTPASFDVSVWEYFWPLVTGATLVIARPEGHRDPDYLRDLIARSGITVLHFVPSMLDVFLEFHDTSVADSPLRLAFCSGEALRPASVARFSNTYPGSRLINLYGPTEAAIDVSYYDCTPQDGTRDVVPIGAPVANTQLHVLNDAMRPCPVGCEGMLYIEGVQLAQGYHLRPDLTDAAFIRHPHAQDSRLYRTGDQVKWRKDGQLIYLGRKDFQVKIRGQRVELGEIEATLLDQPGIARAVVLAASGMLLAFVVPKHDMPRPDPDVLRLGVIDRLPLHMVPARIVVLGDLPTTSNGKLDRKALLALDLPERTTATGPLRQDVIEIWDRVMGTTGGANQDFFDLGGDSIVALRLIAALADIGIAVDMAAFFRTPNLAGLCALADRAQPAAPLVETAHFALLDGAQRQAVSGLDLDDALPLTELQTVMLVHAMRNPGVAIYHDVFTFHLGRPISAEILQHGLERMTGLHEVLRAYVLNAASDRREPIMAIANTVAPVLTQTSVAGDFDETLAHRQDWQRTTGFDFAAPPLIRFELVEGSRLDGRQALIVCFHHLIADGWSIATLMQSLLAFAATGDEKRLVVPTQRFASYVALERAAQTDAASEAHWRKVLLAAEPLMLGRGDPVGSLRAIRRSGNVLLPDRARTLQDNAKGLGVSLKTFCLAAHARALTEFVNRADTVTTFVVDGRPEMTGYDRTLGLHLNTLPLRTDASMRALSAAKFVRAIADAELQALPHRRFAMTQITRRISGRRLGNSVFNFTDFHIYRKDPGLGELVRDVTIHEFTDYDLVSSFSVNPSTGLPELSVDFREDLFSESDIARFAACLAAALDWLAGECDTATPDWRDREASVAALALEEARRDTRLAGADFGPGTDGLGQRVLTLRPSSALLPQMRGFEKPEGALRAIFAGGVDLLCLNRSETAFNLQETFEAPLIDRIGLAAHDSKGPVILDIGANIGVFSLYAVNRWPNAIIYAYEPVPQLAAICSANLAVYAPEAQIHSCAIAASTGTAVLGFYAQNTLMSGLYTSEEDADITLHAVRNAQGTPELFQDDLLGDAMGERMRTQAIEVPTRRLSDEIRRLNLPWIDLLKVDVEKAEADVFAGLDPTEWDRIGAIYVEVHDIDGRLAALTDQFRHKGFAVLQQQDKLLDQTEIYSVVATRNGFAAPDAPRLGWRFSADQLRNALLTDYAARPAFSNLPLQVVMPEVASAIPGMEAQQTVLSQLEIETFHLLWREFFEHDMLDFDTSFYDMGVDSIAILRLLRGFNTRFDAQVQVADLTTNMTPRQLIGLRHLGRDEITFTPPRRERPGGPNLLLLVPFASPADTYAELIRALDPAVAVTVATVDDNWLCKQGIDAAAQTVAERFLVRLSGFDAIGGWSLGGVMAAALCIRLQGQGSKTPELVVIDSYVLPSDNLLPFATTGHADAEIGMAQVSLLRDGACAIGTQKLSGIGFVSSQARSLTSVARSLADQVDPHMPVTIDAGHYEMLAIPHATDIAAHIQAHMTRFTSQIRKVELT